MGFWPIFYTRREENIKYMQQKLNNMVDQALAATNYELWGLEWLQGGPVAILRVYIEGPEAAPVTADDCSSASRQISAVLDVEDCIKQAYTLEVSSPGVERQLFQPEHYQRLLGQSVHVQLKKDLGYGRKLKGKLQAANADEVTLETDEQNVVIPFVDIAKANIYLDQL